MVRPSAYAATLPPRPRSASTTPTTRPPMPATTKSSASTVSACPNGMTPPQAQFTASSTSHQIVPDARPAATPRTIVVPNPTRVRAAPDVVPAPVIAIRSVPVLPEAPEHAERRSTTAQVRDDAESDADHAPEEDLDRHAEEHVGVGHRDDHADHRAEDRPHDPAHVRVVNLIVAAIERDQRRAEDPHHEAPPDEAVLADQGEMHVARDPRSVLLG